MCGVVSVEEARDGVECAHVYESGRGLRFFGASASF